MSQGNLLALFCRPEERERAEAKREWQVFIDNADKNRDVVASEESREVDVPATASSASGR
jgi:hypothetical protein